MQNAAYAVIYGAYCNNNNNPILGLNQINSSNNNNNNSVVIHGQLCQYYNNNNNNNNINKKKSRIQKQNSQRTTDQQSNHHDNILDQQNIKIQKYLNQQNNNQNIQYYPSLMTQTSNLQMLIMKDVYSNFFPEIMREYRLYSQVINDLDMSYPQSNKIKKCIGNNKEWFEQNYLNILKCQIIKNNSIKSTIHDFRMNNIPKKVKMLIEQSNQLRSNNKIEQVVKDNSNNNNNNVKDQNKQYSPRLLLLPSASPMNRSNEIRHKSTSRNQVISSLKQVVQTDHGQRGSKYFDTIDKSSQIVVFQKRQQPFTSLSREKKDHHSSQQQQQGKRYDSVFRRLVTYHNDNNNNVQNNHIHSTLDQNNNNGNNNINSYNINENNNKQYFNQTNNLFNRSKGLDQQNHFKTESDESNTILAGGVKIRMNSYGEYLKNERSSSYVNNNNNKEQLSTQKPLNEKQINKLNLTGLKSNTLIQNQKKLYSEHNSFISPKPSQVSPKQNYHVKTDNITVGLNQQSQDEIKNTIKNPSQKNSKIKFNLLEDNIYNNNSNNLKTTINKSSEIQQVNNNNNNIFQKQNDENNQIIRIIKEEKQLNNIQGQNVVQTPLGVNRVIKSKNIMQNISSGSSNQVLKQQHMQLLNIDNLHINPLLIRSKQNSFNHGHSNIVHSNNNNNGVTNNNSKIQPQIDISQIKNKLTLNPNYTPTTTTLPSMKQPSSAKAIQSKDNYSIQKKSDCIISEVVVIQPQSNNINYSPLPGYYSQQQQQQQQKQIQQPTTPQNGQRENNQNQQQSRINDLRSYSCIQSLTPIQKNKQELHLEEYSKSQTKQNEKNTLKDLICSYYNTPKETSPYPQSSTPSIILETQQSQSRQQQQNKSHRLNQPSIQIEKQHYNNNNINNLLIQQPLLHSPYQNNKDSSFISDLGQNENNNNNNIRTSGQINEKKKKNKKRKIQIISKDNSQSSNQNQQQQSNMRYEKDSFLLNSTFHIDLKKNINQSTNTAEDNSKRNLENIQNTIWFSNIIQNDQQQSNNLRHDSFTYQKTRNISDCCGISSNINHSQTPKNPINFNNQCDDNDNDDNNYQSKKLISSTEGCIIPKIIQIDSQKPSIDDIFYLSTNDQIHDQQQQNYIQNINNEYKENNNNIKQQRIYQNQRIILNDIQKQSSNSIMNYLQKPIKLVKNRKNDIDIIKSNSIEENKKIKLFHIKNYKNDKESLNTLKPIKINNDKSEDKIISQKKYNPYLQKNDFLKKVKKKYDHSSNQIIHNNNNDNIIQNNFNPLNYQNQENSQNSLISQIKIKPRSGLNENRKEQQQQNELKQQTDDKRNYSPRWNDENNQEEQSYFNSNEITIQPILNNIENQSQINPFQNNLNNNCNSNYIEII